MTIRDLIETAITHSDNTANDSLLRTVGGPEAVRRFIAKHDLGSIRFGPGERLLQSGTAGLKWQQTYSAGYAFQKARARSEEHTSELQSLMRISYAVFCLQKKQTPITKQAHTYYRPHTNSIVHI